MTEPSDDEVQVDGGRVEETFQKLRWANPRGPRVSLPIDPGGIRERGSWPKATGIVRG